MDGIATENLLKNRLRQIYSLNLLSLEAESLAGRQIFPVAGVGRSPIFERLLNVSIGKQIEVGSIENAVLILDEKCAHLFRRGQHEVIHSRRHIDGKIRILVEVSGDVIEVSLHAAQMNAHHS